MRNLTTHSMNQIQCNVCYKTKNKEEFSIMSVPYKGKYYRRKRCKECFKLWRRMPKNKDRANSNRRTPEFRLKRRLKRKLPHIKEQERIAERRQLKTNPSRRVKKNLRDRLRIALKVKKWFKTTSFYQYIGCSQEELKKHLEIQFKEGMTWENYGQWHIDHIIPLSVAKTPEEMHKLCHFTNLQPLWAQDNINKSNKI